MEIRDAQRLKAAALDLMAHDRFEEAAFIYEELLELAPDDVEAVLDLAYLYTHVLQGEGRGDLLWRRALEIAPDDIDALFWSAYHDIVEATSKRDTIFRAPSGSATSKRPCASRPTRRDSTGIWRGRTSGADGSRRPSSTSSAPRPRAGSRWIARVTRDGAIGPT